jgi:hypothetical protein
LRTSRPICLRWSCERAAAVPARDPRFCSRDCAVRFAFDQADWQRWCPVCREWVHVDAFDEVVCKDCAERVDRELRNGRGEIVTSRLSRGDIEPVVLAFCRAGDEVALAWDTSSGVRRDFASTWLAVIRVDERGFVEVRVSTVETRRVRARAVDRIRSRTEEPGSVEAKAATGAGEVA